METSRFAFSRPPRALVAGGAGGIGLAVATRLAELGASVAIGDLPAALEQRARGEHDGRDAHGGGPPFLELSLDVRDEASVRGAVATAARELGGLDTLVNAAGIVRLHPLEEVVTDEWDAILDVNLRGTFLVLREAMPHLRASGAGRVVNVASDAGKRGYPNLAAYCASKFGVVGLTQAVAAEVGPAGVRVNAVCPSTIADTPMGDSVAAQRIALGQAGDLEELAAQRRARFPLGRPGTVVDVVEAILFLLSDSAGWISGESLNIDGASLAG